MNSYLSHGALAGFIGAITIVSAFSFIYIFRAEELKDKSERLRNINNTISCLNKIVSLLKDVEVEHHQFVISGNKVSLEQYSTILHEIDEGIINMELLLANDLDQRMRFNRVKFLIDRKLNYTNKYIDLVLSGRLEEEEALLGTGEGSTLMKAIVKLAAKIEEREKHKLSQEFQMFDKNSFQSIVLILSGLTITLLIIVMGVFKVLKDSKHFQHLEAELFKRNKELEDKNQQTERLKVELRNAGQVISKHQEDSLSDHGVVFKNVLISFPTPVIIFNTDQKLLFINDSAIKNLGISILNYENKSPEELFSVEKAFEIQSYLTKTIHLKKPNQAEIAFSLNHKEYIFITRFIPLFEEAGQVEKVMIAAYDISDRKNFEKKIMQLNDDLEKMVKDRTVELEDLNHKLLKQSEDITDLFENAPLGFFSIDPNGNFIKVNQTALTLLGYKKEEILNQNIVSLLIAPEKREFFARKLEEFVSTGKIENREDEFVRKDGIILPVLLNATAVYDEKDNFIMSRTAFIDNTELRKARKENEKVLEALQVANKELEAFSYSISHDLRAPLRSINGFSSILKNDFAEQLNEEGKKYLDIILQNTLFMENLINDFLEFAKLGQKAISKIFFDMNELVSTVTTDLLTHLPKDREIKIAREGLPKIWADPILIRQVWTNLISNAIKFSANQNPSLISISSVEKEDEYIFYVKDNGIGFDTNYSYKLFSVFQRLHSYEEFAGTGVGLAIVQRIVLAHGGKVGAESKLGEGATFFFSLPKK